jgi:hypothetical protein
MERGMISRILSTRDEAEAFHWIGASVVTLWSTLPYEVQEAIVQRALAMASGDVEASSQINAFTQQRSGTQEARSEKSRSPPADPIGDAVDKDSDGRGN